MEKAAPKDILGSRQADSAAKRLIFFLLCVLGLSLFAHQIIDTDIWWHLSAGRYIVQTGSIPATDPFSYTAGGNEWIDLHWLFQVLVYGVHQTIGSYGLSLLFICVYAAAFLVSWLTYRRDNPPLLTLFFLWLALMAGSSRFLARPEAFTYLMIALYTLILYRHDRGRGGRWIYSLIPLQVLWTNVQGLFILGPCLIFAYAAESTAALFLAKEKIHSSRLKKLGRTLLAGPERAKRLMFLFLATTAASFLNPYGLKGLLFPLILFTRAGGIENIFAGSIAELQPPFSGYNLTTPLIFFGLLTVLIFFALALDWRNARLSHIIIFIGMGYLGLTARRNVPVFIFSAIPLAVEHFGNLLKRWREDFQFKRWPLERLKIPAYMLFMAIIIYQTLRVWNNDYYISDRRAERFGIGFKEEAFPTAALQFIKEEGLRGPFFNSLDMGGMFMWELFPREKVFIDPRLEVNSEVTFAEYVRLLSDPKSFDALARKYNLNAAVISHISQDGLGLLPVIYTTPGWFLIHLDPVAAVFARGTFENTDIIAKNRIDLSRDEPVTFSAGDSSLNADNHRLLKSISKYIAARVPSDSTAQEKFNLGLVFLVLGQNERAAEQLKAGIDLRPDFPEAFYNLGLAFDRMGRKGTAVHCYKSAIELDADHAAAHANLGRLYDEQGFKDEAEKEYRLALRSDRNSIISLYNLGSLYYERGEWEAARECWTRALKVDPSFQPALDALKRLQESALRP